MFHVRQGAMLFIAEIVAIVLLTLLGGFLNSLFSFGTYTFMKLLNNLAWLFFAGVSGVGVYFAVKGVEKSIPVLSTFSRNLKM